MDEHREIEKSRRERQHRNEEEILKRAKGLSKVHDVTVADALRAISIAARTADNGRLVHKLDELGDKIG